MRRFARVWACVGVLGVISRTVAVAGDFHLSFRLKTSGRSTGVREVLCRSTDGCQATFGLSPTPSQVGKPYFAIAGGPVLAGVLRADDGNVHDVMLLRHGNRYALMVDEFVCAEAESVAAVVSESAKWTRDRVDDFRLVCGLPVNPAVVPVAELEKNSYDWTNRHERILREGPLLRPEVVLIGDSITHCWAGWHSIGGEDCSAEWKRDFAGLRALDLGFGFDRTQNLLWRIDHGELDGLKPKVVVLLAGINNLGSFGRRLHARGNTSWETADGILAVRDRIAAKLPRAHILVMSVFPRGWARDSNYRPLPRAVNERLRRQCAGLPNTTYVDAWDALLEKDGTMTKAVCRDEVHLASEGFRRWRLVLDPYLNKTPPVE